MSLHDQYFHWVWGENRLRHDKPEYLINLEHGLSIRFELGDAMYATFDEFVDGIADIQFLTGERPDTEELDDILTDAWNYLGYEERQLERDVEGMKDDEFDENAN